MRRDAAGWIMTLVACAWLCLGSAVNASAGDVHAGDDLRSPTLLAKEGGKKKGRDDDLSPEEKARLQKKIRQWQSLSPQEQQQMRQKMQQLNRMPPEAQQLYQKRFRQWQRLSPEEQQHLRRQLEHWDGLSREEKQSIRKKFK